MQLKKVKLIVTLLVFAVTVSLSGIKAFAYVSHDTSSVGGVNVYVGSTALMYYANATTTGSVPNSGIDASVSSTYRYVNMYTGEDGSDLKYSFGVNGVTVSFTSPDDCYSVNIESYHVAEYGGGRWFPITFQTYPNTIS